MNYSLIQHMANEVNLAHQNTPLPLTSIKSVGEFRRKIIDVLRKVNVSHKPEHSKAGQMHKETGRTVLCINPDDGKSLITVYSRKILQVVKSMKDLKKLLIPDSIKDEWNEHIAEDKAKQAKLVKNFEIYANTAEQILIAENEKAVSEGKKEIAITESRILTKTFYIIQEKKLWKGDKFRSYENNSSLVFIPKHGVNGTAYEGRNNYRVDFYKKDGKIGWEVIRCFDINQKEFKPQWQQQGGKIIWSAQQGDLLELGTPEEWQSYNNKPRCLAKVKKFSEGEFNIDYISDARMTSPQNKELDYMFVKTLRKGLSYYIQHKARKVELTPFGKIKKKHKVLSNGETRAA